MAPLCTPPTQGPHHQGAAAQLARSTPQVACTLVAQHLTPTASSHQALAALAPLPDFPGAYEQLLEGFGRGARRVEGPPLRSAPPQLRLRQRSLVMDGVEHGSLATGPSLAPPEGCFA